jgi:hypothetical protein
MNNQMGDTGSGEPLVLKTKNMIEIKLYIG